MLDDLKHIKSPAPDWLAEALSTPRVQRSVISDGCRINFFTWGDARKPTLLLLHGRMSHARCWAFIAPALSQDYHCIAMDSSGMGDSGHRDTYTYATRAREVLAVLDATGVREALLVSHSYGAVTALNAHGLAPERCAGLIACDPSIHHPDTWAEQTPRLDGPALERPHKIHQSLDALVERFAFAPPQPYRHDILRTYIAVHSVCAVAEGWRWKFDPWVYSPKEEGHNDWWVRHTQTLATAPMPKAIIYGERSEFTGTATVAAVAAVASELVGTHAIADAHHHLMVDQPHTLTDAIAAMAARIWPRATR